MLQINGWRPHTTRRIHLCMIVDITRFVAVNQSSPTRLIWRNFPGLRNQQLIVSPTELTSSLSQFELLHSNQPITPPQNEICYRIDPPLCVRRESPLRLCSVASQIEQGFQGQKLQLQNKSSLDAAHGYYDKPRRPNRS